LCSGFRMQLLRVGGFVAEALSLVLVGGIRSLLLKIEGHC